MSQKAKSPKKRTTANDGPAEDSEQVADAGAEAAEKSKPANRRSPAPEGDADDAVESRATNGADAQDEADTAEQRIAELEAELSAARDRQLRALAELENVRKRADRERAENARYGGVRLARDLLSAHDAFDRLFAAMDEGFRKEQKQFAEGAELIHREILSAFERHDIRPIVPERNETFDPHFHQAMFKEIDDDVEPGRIVRVLEKGFRLGDRLLRAARVSLADERVVAAKHEPPPSTPVPGESVGEETGVDPLDGAGAAGNGSVI